MRIAYADPPYLGLCSYYEHTHPDGRCWDEIETHRLLIARLSDEFPDGWALSCAVGITLRRGFTGAKPQGFSFWLFDLMGLRATDEFADLFHGSGAVSAAWEKWRTARPDGITGALFSEVSA